MKCKTQRLPCNRHSIKDMIMPATQKLWTTLLKLILNPRCSAFILWQRYWLFKQSEVLLRNNLVNKRAIKVGDTWGYLLSETKKYNCKVEAHFCVSVCWRRSRRGRDCRLILKLGPADGGLRTPPLSLQYTFRPEFPQWEPSSRAQPWESPVLLRPAEQYTWLKPVKASI